MAKKSKSKFNKKQGIAFGIIGIVAVLSLIVFSSVQSFVYESDTLGYWKFNNNTVDELGQSDFDAFGEGIQYVDATVGQGIDITDGESGIEIMSEDFDAVGLKTIDVWAKFPEGLEEGIEIVAENPEGQNSYNFGVYPYLEDGTEINYYFQIYFGEGSECELDAYIDYEDFEGEYNISGFNHYVSVFNGTDLYFYINGVLANVDGDTSCVAEGEFVNNSIVYLEEGYIDNLLFSSSEYDLGDVLYSYNDGSGRDFNYIAPVIKESSSAPEETAEKSYTVTVAEPVELNFWQRLANFFKRIFGGKR